MAVGIHSVCRSHFLHFSYRDARIHFFSVSLLFIVTFRRFDCSIFFIPSFILRVYFILLLYITPELFSQKDPTLNALFSLITSRSENIQRWGLLPKLSQPWNQESRVGVIFDEKIFAEDLRRYLRPQSFSLRWNLYSCLLPLCQQDRPPVKLNYFPFSLKSRRLFEKIRSNNSVMRLLSEAVLLRVSEKCYSI